MSSTTTYDANLIPDGGVNVAFDNGDTSAAYEMVSGASMPIDTVMGIGQGSGGLCSKSLSIEIVDTFPDIGGGDAVIIENGDGTNWYRLKVLSDGSAEFRWASGGYDYKFTTAAGTLVVGTKTQYATKTQTLIFVLSNNGLNGQFYYGIVTGELSAITTTRAAVS